jgi:hypothetical protein
MNAYSYKTNFTVNMIENEKTKVLIAAAGVYKKPTEICSKPMHFLVKFCKKVIRKNHKTVSNVWHFSIFRFLN